MTWLLGGSRYAPATSPLDILLPPRDPLDTGEAPEFTEGLVKSFGLGTVLREFQIPSGAPRQRQGGRGGTRKETQADLERRRAEMGALDEEQWKGSEFFREGIKWDARMTQDRAAALADWHDESRYRQLVASERQGFASNAVGFLAGLGGQALDPINYVPVLGPATRAAAVARAGTVGGRMMTASSDAALNTALFGAATAPSRAALGDDVSFEAFIAEVAGAAIIGSAFGGAEGVVRRIRDMRSANTLKQQGEARAMLDEAVSAIIHDRPISMSTAATGRLQEMPFELRADANRAAMEVSPREAIDAAVQSRVGDAVAQLDMVERQITMNTTTREAITRELATEDLSRARAQMIEVDRISEDVARLEKARDKQTNPREIEKLQQRIDAKRGEARAIIERLDDEKVQRIEELQDALQMRDNVLSELDRKRTEVAPTVDSVKAQERNAYWKEQARLTQQRKEAQAAIDGTSVTYEHPAEYLPPDAVTWRPQAVGTEPPPQIADGPIPATELARVARDVSRPEKPNDLLMAVDDEVINAELDRLRARGLMTEADEKALADATEIEAKAEAYNKAMEAAALCKVA